MSTLHEDRCVFVIIPCWILLRIINVSDKRCRGNKHTFCVQWPHTHTHTHTHNIYYLLPFHCKNIWAYSSQFFRRTHTVCLVNTFAHFLLSSNLAFCQIEPSPNFSMFSLSLPAQMPTFGLLMCLFTTLTSSFNRLFNIMEQKKYYVGNYF